MAERPLVLIVDDNEMMARACALVLEREAGVRSRIAFDTLGALQLIAQETPSLVITDVRRPESDRAGLELLARLREDVRTAGVRVVATSVGVSAQEAREGSFDAVLEKPFLMRQLVDVVTRLLPSDERPSVRSAGADERDA